jgi:hypothetical protein
MRFVLNYESPYERLAMVYQKISKSASSNPKTSEKSASIPPRSIPSPQAPIAHFHDFTQIPVHSPVIQAKLTIGSPNDRYEQEADRVASQVVQQLHRPASLLTARVQTKLTMGEPGDLYEREADEIASRVVRHQERMSQSPAILPSVSPDPIMVQPMLQRQISSFPEEEEMLQARGTGIADITSSLEERITVKAGMGQPLAKSVQQKMESSFNTSFDGVRIHTDTEAAQMNQSLHAEAFTYGNDIYFGASRFDPSSKSGSELLAHELTHTLQQSGIQRRAIQCRGGAKVGELSVHSNAISAGLTAGHAWLAYRPMGGALMTYGTWGNVNPIGLHHDRELSYTPGTGNRTTDLDATDYGNLASFAGANNAWSLINNCASFAARGWRSVTGEAVSYTNMIGIPNPSSLGAGIKSANGGTNSGVLGVGVAAAGSGLSGGGSSSL